MPSPSWISARTVIEQQDVLVAADQYRQQLTRFDDAYEALKWLLARNCEKLGFHRSVGATEYRLYRQAGDPAAQSPNIIITFFYNDNEVIIIGLRAEPFYQKSP